MPHDTPLVGFQRHLLVVRARIIGKYDPQPTFAARRGLALNEEAPKDPAGLSLKAHALERRHLR